MEKINCCPPSESSRMAGAWPLIGLSVGFLLILGISQLFLSTQEFGRVLLEDTLMMLGPILAGLFLGGLIDSFVPASYVSSFLSRPKKRVLVYSVSLGFLMSSCSHGMLALAMELNRKGASKAAVISFLLASPWANLPITILLFGFFGARALLIVFAAVLIALITGFLFQQLEKKGWLQPNPHTLPAENLQAFRFPGLKECLQSCRDKNFLEKHTKGIFRGAGVLAEMVLPWLFLGLLLAAASAAWIPEHFFHRFFGPSFLGLLSSLGAATVMEVCSEGTAPLAFEMYKQTHAFGNVFVFLMAGVVTDFTEISLVWKNMGFRSALVLVLGALPWVILLGGIFNWL